MDLVIQTSLDALLLKAITTDNLNFDTVAVDAFCALVCKEKDGPHIGVKVIASNLTSGKEKEILQILNVLDVCMKKCGTPFQNEIGKFRFLNEMIKLVSPKYLGSETPVAVKQKILQLFYVWTIDYPKETKIKEAYDMLRKQGVIKDIPNPCVSFLETTDLKKKECTLFQDEEKSKILQKLLQSKDPEDVQAANWLIKSMVKEEDKRTELKSKTITELQSIQNNVRLLNEMLDSYTAGVSSAEEMELITELYQNCQRIKTPSIDNLMKELGSTELKQIKRTPEFPEEMLCDVIDVREELTATISRYKKIISGDKSPLKPLDRSDDTFLHFDVVDAKPFTGISSVESQESSKSTVDVLNDIFTSTNIPNNGDVLQPISLVKNEQVPTGEDEKPKHSKFKALEDLDVLSDLLKKENLQKASHGNFSNHSDKTPLNLLNNTSEKNKPDVPDPLNLDLNYLLAQSNKTSTDCTKSDQSEDVTDDCLVDISDEKMLDVEKTSLTEAGPHAKEQVMITDIRLNDIFVKLENIKPSNCPPQIILEEKNGISVTLHLAKDKPKPYVNVYVITTSSKNELPLSNYLFQAVVPKECKLKLLTPSTTNLPAYNPFLPPSAITQIMLLANPNKTKLSLKFILSYTIDEESNTEMGEIVELPIL